VSAGASVRLLTPPGIGGIAVVELRGSAAEKLLRGCFQPAGRAAASFDAGRIHYGRVFGHGEVLDEVLVLRLPVSGGVPTFEINCHGGMVPARRMIDFLVACGASVDGRAETVLGRPLKTLERGLLDQLVHARTERAAEVLLVQLSGRLRAALEGVSGPVDDGSVRRVARLRATWKYGRRLVEPASVVITGAPNVGKSTLANALVGGDRSIVHHIPGTTRDTVTAVAWLDGLPVVVVDTAGLREATGEIERIGVEKALEKVSSCDLVVWVFDHSRGVTDDEADYLEVLGDMPLLPVINKIDLEGPVDASEIRKMLGVDVQRTCALTGRGIEQLRKRIFTSLVGETVPTRDAPVVTLRDVAAALDEAAAKLDSTDVTEYALNPSLLT